MRAIEPGTSTEECHETKITIQVPKHYTEVVEVHRSMETGSVYVQVTLVKSLAS